MVYFPSMLSAFIVKKRSSQSRFFSFFVVVFVFGK